MSKATIKRTRDGRWLVAIGGRPPGVKFETHGQAVAYATSAARRNVVEVKVHAEFRRLTQHLSPMGAINRLNEALGLPRRRIIAILGRDVVGEEMWIDYRMDGFK